MKELSIEEKARAYDELFTKAKQIYNKENDVLIMHTIEDLFPELKESEDEKIRKSLLKWLQSNSYTSIAGIQINDIIAWLEKQGEQKKSYDTSDSSIMNNKKSPYGEKRDFGYFEEKSADKVEPKFKVGDWLILGENHNSIYQVERIDNYRYYLRHYLGGTLSVYFDNELIRLWTIQDAKDGDVLAGSKNEAILIFRGIGNTEWNDIIDYHCYYDCYREDVIVQEDLEHWGDIKNNQLKPATKEQRDLLSQKMKESGYEWNAEKKTLSCFIKDMDYKKAYKDSLGMAKKLWKIYNGERHIIEFIFPEVCYLKDKKNKL